MEVVPAHQEATTAIPAQTIVPNIAAKLLMEAVLIIQQRAHVPLTPVVLAVITSVVTVAHITTVLATGASCNYCQQKRLTKRTWSSFFCWLYTN